MVLLDEGLHLTQALRRVAGVVNGDNVHGVAVDTAMSVSPLGPDTRDGEEEGIAV